MIMYTNAHYIISTQTGENCAIVVTIGDREWSVPLDPANTDYANIMALVEKGDLTIVTADTPNE